MRDPLNNILHPATQKILGLDFEDLGLADGLKYACEKRGVVVFPSGSCMERLGRYPEHWDALAAADVRFVDSGALALFWRWVSGRKIKRVSGYAFLETFIGQRYLEPSSVFWVMPSEEESDQHREWLETVGFPVHPDRVYVAPWYSRDNAVADAELLACLERLRPAAVVICLSGGVQEPLAVWLRDNLSCRPLILCTGAAIGFLSGTQSRIPLWADRWYLGWLFRCLENPARYGRRYLRVLRLMAIVRRYREARPIRA